MLTYSKQLQFTKNGCQSHKQKTHRTSLGMPDISLSTLPLMKQKGWQQDSRLTQSTSVWQEEGKMTSVYKAKVY